MRLASGSDTTSGITATVYGSVPQCTAHRQLQRVHRPAGVTVLSVGRHGPLVEAVVEGHWQAGGSAGTLYFQSALFVAGNGPT